ncbi:DUF3300 domain-containing protein [Caballeronia sp. LZ019]|nr:MULTISPECIES: DUF3300 domain-containing protein [unclassified Caballeronia]MDR5738733.1 DUF3300 domain-containing protein [Caballeronia sp. LZ016]MDR5811398.1 DUF3300 domain-containing protein [Caballeronia sp. LZ019]
MLHAPPVHAQAQGNAPAQKLTNQQLDALVAPIALYPDALLAQVLMAATYPQDIEAAAQWSKANPNIKGDDAVKAVQSEPWDPSVQSLVAFPQALATMASRLDWVTQLGNAFIAQSSDVMDSVQRLRRSAQSAGNLKTTEQQKVVVEQSTIQIVPANPEVVYVPTYNPTVVYGAWPYPAYPPVYVPPPPGYAIATGFATGLAFGAGIAVANSLWGNCDWNRGDVNVNVNRYNNINVNNRINANSNNVRWNRNDPQFNRNTNVNRQNRVNNQNLASVNRDQFRGRDQARAQAAQTLQQRTGQNMNQTANQRVQNMRQGGAGNGDLHQRAQNVNRDNALRGAGDGNVARQDMQRGQASRQSLASAHPNAGGGFERQGNAGGGIQRSGGGFQGGGAGGFHGGGGGGFHGGGGGFRR